MGPFKDYRTIVDNNLIALSTDSRGMIIFASKAYSKISGYQPDELEHLHISQLVHADVTSQTLKQILNKLKSDGDWQGELKLPRKNLGFYWVDIKILPNLSEKGSLLGYTSIMHDITDRKRVEELTKTVAEEERLIEKHQQIISDYVITSSTDQSGKITSVSRAFCHVSGYSETELIGQHHRIIRHPDTPDHFYKTLWSVISQGHEWKGEVKNRKKDGNAYWVELYIKPNKDETGQVVGHSAVSQDITDKKRLEELTITDELTGAYNRRFYNQVLEQEINRAKRNRLWVGFLMVDADNFKKYNDSYGHQAGDEVLQSIVKVLNDGFRRGGDYVFRLGGEEFAVLFTTESKAQLFAVAERSRQAMFDLNIEHSGNAPHYRVTVSMGLMELDPDLNYVSEEIYKYADEALYRAKQNGRNVLEAVEPDNDDIELF